jgi:Tol biopolymer transport system component
LHENISTGLPQEDQIMSRRTIASNKIRLMLLAMLLLCYANATPHQRLDSSSSNNRNLLVAPTQVSASQVSSGGLIAFSADNQIYVMSADGSNLRRLTDGGPLVSDHYPAFSPDGLRIAFTRLDHYSSQYSLCIVNIDGSGLQYLTSGYTVLSEPAWSPDGSTIALIHGHDTTLYGYAFNSSCPPEIYAIDVATHKQVSLTKGAGGTDPAWSPDGTRIAFSSYRDENHEIYTMASDGSHVQRLTYTDGAEAEPAWSPDGKQIAYAANLIYAEVGCGFIPTGRPSQIGAQPSSIYIMEADGTNQTSLDVTGGGYDPTWSPDGSSLAFVHSRKTDTQIYVTDARGMSLIQLTSDSEQKTSPSWSNMSR